MGFGMDAAGSPASLLRELRRGWIQISASDVEPGEWPPSVRVAADPSKGERGVGCDRGHPFESHVGVTFRASGRRAP